MLAAWLLLAGVLLVGGATTVRRPDQVGAAFTTLRVPRVLHRAWIARAHPWAEILLAVLLLTVPAPAALAVAVVALALFTTYLVLVWDAVARGEQGSCHCFGSVGSGALDGWAVARNAVFWMLAAVVVLDAALGGSAWERLAPGPGTWAWVLALLATVAVTVLVTRGGAARGGGASPDGSTPTGVPAYRPVPDVALDVGPDVALDVGGPDAARVPLRELATDRPQLLLLLNPTCGPCTLIGRRVQGWTQQVPGVDFRIVTPLSRQAVQATAPEWVPHYAGDDSHEVDAALGRPARPAAVLLTRDGLTGDSLTSAGPVLGVVAIEQLVSELRDHPHVGPGVR